ncbi:MAG: PAS domain-containing sensor histidine kinase, partial [Pseudomonadota bacterium]
MSRPMSREPSTPSASSGPSFDKEGDGPEPLDSLLRNLPGNIVRRVLHPDGRITYAFLSSGLRDTFDIEPGDITAQPDAGFEWIHPDDREGFRAALLHSAEALTPIDLENRVVGRDGAIRWVRSIATTRRLEDGRVIWDGIALDVTDKRRAEDEQKAALARAEAADDAKTKFLAAASHDLRQPLQAMRFLLSSLGAAGTDAARAAVLGDLERCLDATDTLLAALLDISKLDAGLIVPSNEIIALRPTLEAIVNEVTPMAEAAGLRLELRCQDGAVRTDPALLTSICRNLLHNAIKFSPSGAWVTVRANAGSRPRISIADEGPGIPAAERSRVFEPFVQLSNVARDRSQGLGLGLAIVARSAALLGAQIRLRSCEGRGSVFLLRLP